MRVCNWEMHTQVCCAQVHVRRTDEVRRPFDFKYTDTDGLLSQMKKIRAEENPMVMRAGCLLVLCIYWQ